ncbi:MAG: hypothetical protein J5523_01435 [Muribaculaceae bacterium]|nr:hypothetical protein [Muribaculaceae bacterium]
MSKQDYLDNLETFIHEPESVGFGDEIIPVAMWLRNYMPGTDDMSACNKSSNDIRSLLCDIVEVSVNDVSRLMVLNGYSLGGANQSFPEWLMQPIADE